MLWQSAPTLVVGKFQNTFEEINLRYAEEKGIAVVRRMSGGGTVYQDEGECQFAFIDYDAPQGIDFASYLKPIVACLRNLGVDASFSGRNDLLAGGRKFSGNAQYRIKNTTVHHGTLLFDTDISEMVAATAPDPYKIESKSIKSVRERVVNLRELLPDMDMPAFREHIAAAVAGTHRPSYALTVEDNRRIEQIADEIFRPWEFRFGKNPRFDVVKAGHFTGGSLEFRLRIERGRIAQAALFGDFFSESGTAQITDALIGLPYRTEDIRKALLPFEHTVYGVTAEEMAELIAK